MTHLQRTLRSLVALVIGILHHASAVVRVLLGGLNRRVQISRINLLVSPALISVLSQDLANRRASPAVGDATTHRTALVVLTAEILTVQRGHQPAVLPTLRPHAEKDPKDLTDGNKPLKDLSPLPRWPLLLPPSRSDHVRATETECWPASHPLFGAWASLRLVVTFLKLSIGFIMSTVSSEVCSGLIRASPSRD